MVEGSAVGEVASADGTAMLAGATVGVAPVAAGIDSGDVMTGSGM